MFSEVLFPLFFLYRAISFVTLIRLTSAYRIDKQPGFISWMVSLGVTCYALGLDSSLIALGTFVRR
jgi:hypothetical protein